MPSDPAVEGDDQQIHQRPERVHHRRAPRDVQQIVGVRIGGEAEQADRREAVAAADGVDRDPAERAIEAEAQAVEDPLGRRASRRPVIVGVVVGQVEVGEARVHQAGGQRGRRAERVAARTHGHGVLHGPAPLPARMPALVLGSHPLALLRRARVGEHAFEVADDEIAGQERPRPIEQAAAAVGRHAVGQRRRAQVDVADEGKPDGHRSAAGGGGSGAGGAGGAGGGAETVSRAGSVPPVAGCHRRPRAQPTPARGRPGGSRLGGAAAAVRLPGDLAEASERRRAIHHGEQLVDRLRTVEPVSATRTGCRASPSLSPCASAICFSTSRMRSARHSAGRTCSSASAARSRLAAKAGAHLPDQRLALGDRAARGRDPAARRPARPRGEWCASGSSPRRSAVPDPGRRRRRPCAPARAARPAAAPRRAAPRGTGRSSTRAWSVSNTAAFFWMPSSVNSSIISASGRISRSPPGDQPSSARKFRMAAGKMPWSW